MTLEEETIYRMLKQKKREELFGKFEISVFKIVMILSQGVILAAVLK